MSIKKVGEHQSHQLIARHPADMQGQLPVGFRYLVNGDGHVIESPLLFLKKKCAPYGYLKSVWSAITYADHLYEWFSFLEAVGIPWYEATSDTIAAYSAALHNHASVHTKKRLKEKTRKGRLRTIVSFYKFCEDDWLILRAPQIDLADIPKDDEPPDLRPAGPAARDAVNEIIVPPSAHAVCIPEEHLGAIFSRLGPKSSEQSERSGPTCRNRLAAEVSVHTGGRLEEVTSLRKAQVLSLVPRQSRNDPCSLYLTKTKRSKPRTVYLPSWLVSELHDYIDGERSAVVEAAKARNPQYVEPKELFLNGMEATNRDIGKPLSRHTLMQSFSTAVKAAGIFVEEAAFDCDTGKPYVKKEPAYSFHNLRHTFAYTVYYVCLKAGYASPLRIVQHLLGHKRYATTRDRYLAGADIQEAAVSDALVAAFASWSGLAHAEA